MRQAIRNSWAKEAGNQFLVRFIIGQNSTDNVGEALKSEQQKFGDLILYDLPDTYENLYLKIHAAMSWQQTFCPEVEYWLKTDDDTVVDLKRLLHWIQSHFDDELKLGKAAIFGTTWKGAKPYRNESHRWFVPKEVYDKNRWPTYFNGPTYLMTTEAVEAILARTAEVNAFRIEDILFTGVLAEAARVKKHNHPRNFRLGSKLSKREPCDKHRVPYVLALYNFDTPAKLTDAYERMHSVKCK
ncbi:Glycosyl transferase [Aphelenchoides avenae]|nr:Glycosyl transferase [Aphelenchus avenae]